MAQVTSFAQAHAAITGGKGASAAPSVSSSSGSNSFQAARTMVIQNNQQNNTATKVKAASKPTLNVQQAFSSGGLTKNTAPKPIQPPQNSFQTLAGNIYKGVVGEIGSKLNPHPTVSTPTPVVSKTVKLPMGIKLNLTDDRKPDQSAQRKVTPQSLQQQKTAVATGNKVLNPIKNAFPQTDQSVRNILSDPFNYNVIPQILVNPKKTVSDVINDLNLPKTMGKQMQDSQNFVKQNKDVMLGKKGTKDQTIAAWLHTVSNQANFVFSPLSAIFTAADRLPIVGGLSKLITLPFTAAGEGGAAAAGKIIDELPISDKAKQNLKPAVKEIGTLAGQLILGHITTIGGEKKAQLVDKYGSKDAKIIVDQAGKIAQQKMIQPGVYAPSEMRNEVFKRNMQDSELGKEIIKSTFAAEQNGQHIEITTPNVQALDKNISDYRSYGGHTDGTSTENAALRDIASVAGQPDVVKHTQEKVQRAIDRGDVNLNEDGTITLYRGGKLSDHNQLVSAAYTKEAAQPFADNEGTPVKEFNVKPEDIKAFIGRSEAEVLVDKKVANSGFKSVGEILNKNNNRTITENKPNTSVDNGLKASTKPQEKFAGGDQPVGQGKTKESAAYKHRLEELAVSDPQHYEYLVDKNGKVTYNVNKATEDMQKAADLLQKNPQEAFDVAMGYKPTPQGQTTNAVAIAVSDRAAKEGNFDLVSQVETKMSLRSTRGGQENAALRGRFDANSPHKFIQQVIDQRMRRLGGETALTKNIELAKKAFGKVTTSAKERAVAKIDAAVERAQKFTKQERAKIDFAQNLLDQLTCK